MRDNPVRQEPRWLSSQVPHMPPKLSPIDADNLVRRYMAGEGTKEVGAAFGVSGRTVSEYLRRAGVQARPAHHAVVAYQANLSSEERSANATRAMLGRWASATGEQRAAMLDPAHAASRGAVRTAEQRRRMVEAKSLRGGSDSAYEEQVAQWLRERGAVFTQQVAIGEHCVDFTVGPVAVEFTTGWARKQQWDRRFSRLFDDGWHLYVIWHDTRDVLLPTVTDDLLAYVQILETNPPVDRQHRVIWRSRQILSAGGGDADYVAGVLKSSTPNGSWPLYNRAGD